MDMEKFQESLTKALGAFNAQEEVIKGLQEKIAELEKGIVLYNDTQDKNVDYGFWNTEKHATDFVDFWKAIVCSDSENVKAMSEGTDSEGGYLVPQEFLPVLIRVIEMFGLIRQNATVIPMTKEEMNVPKLTTGVTVYWIDENAAITATGQPVFGNVLLTAKKLCSLIPSSNELVEDSALPIANLLVTLIAEAMAKEEDLQGLVGDGSPFTGLLEDTDVVAQGMGTGDTDFADVDADDLSDLISVITTGCADGAGYIMHRTIFNLVRKLKDTTGSPIYAHPGQGQPGTIWGYPYTLSDVMPAIGDTAVSTPFIAFGNLKHIYLGDRKKATMSLSQHVGFANDQSYLRVIQRESIMVAIPEAFSKLVTAAV